VTQENRRENIKEELQRADESRRAALFLFENGFRNDGVSRLYYFVYHSVKALLLTKGLEPKSHEGTLRLLGLHFIKTGIFKPADSHIFSRLMKYREEADYNPSYSFTEEDTLLFAREAEELHGIILKYLKENMLV